VSIDPTDEFESAALTLHLPEEFAPGRNDFAVHYEDFRKTPGQLEDSVELAEKLEFCGPSHVELRIAYPLPGFRYYISWRLPDVDFTRSEQTAAKIRTQAASLFERAVATVRGPLKESDLRIGLYTRPAGKPLVLERLAGHNGCPAQIPLNDPRSRVRPAFWAAMIIPDRDPGYDRLPDESLLVYLPIRSQWAEGERAAALLRIAVLGGSPLDWDQEGSMPDGVEQFFERSALGAAGIARDAEGA
jgi:hypothetical protein